MKPSKQQSDCKPTSTNTTSPLGNVAEDGEGSVGSKKIFLNPVSASQFKKPEKGIGSRLSDEVYEKVCQDLIDGKSIITVALAHSVSNSTVQTIKKSIKDHIPDWKQRTSNKLGEIISELADSLHQDLREGRLSPDKKSVSIGILSDKKRDLDGEKTVIEHRKVDSKEDFRKQMDAYLDSLPSAKTVDLVQTDENPSIIDVPPDDCTETAQK